MNVFIRFLINKFIFVSGFLSWDEEKAHVDIHKEIATISELNLEGESQKGGQFNFLVD